MRERLEALQRFAGVDTNVEVIRRALAAYEYLWTEKSKRGAKVVFQYDDGTERELLLM